MKKNSDRMYYQGDTNRRMRMTTLINDHVRVYKGGSWKDRAYWLAGTRRFLDEASSTKYWVRCAIAVGAQSAKKRGERIGGK